MVGTKFIEVQLEQIISLLNIYKTSILLNNNTNKSKLLEIEMFLLTMDRNSMLPNNDRNSVGNAMLFAPNWSNSILLKH